MKNSTLNRFDLKAAIIFIAAHFISVFIYDTFIIDGRLLDGKSGVDLRALQASIYILIPMFSMSKGLKLASLSVATAYMLSATVWLMYSVKVESTMQAYFYAHFSSIIITLNLIVIYLLGVDSAIRIFNNVFARCRLCCKSGLLHRSADHYSVCNINLHVCTKNIKNTEGCK